jgi:hypothetical protein
MEKENKKCKHESEDEEDDSENEDEEDDSENEENKDKKDVVYKFMELVQKKEITFIITGGAFNMICNMNGDKDERIRISPMVYWAHGEIQLVMRDLLERLDNKKYKEKTVKDLVLSKTHKDCFMGYFMYKDVNFFVYNVHNDWTLCLMSE